MIPRKAKFRKVGVGMSRKIMFMRKNSQKDQTQVQKHYLTESYFK